MIEIQILLMNISIIALCVAMVYMRRYIKNVDKQFPEINSRLYRLEGDSKAHHVASVKYAYDVLYLMEKDKAEKIK